MTKIEISKRDLVFLGIASAVAAVLTVVWMALTGNAPQVYKDIVIEWTAIARSNKGAEIMLLRLLILLGSAAVCCYVLLFKKKNSIALDGEKKADAALYFVAWICSVIVLKYQFLQQVSNIFLFALYIAGMAFIIEKECVLLALCGYFISYYALFAVYHSCNFLGAYDIVKSFANMNNYPSAIALIFAILCTVVLLCSKQRRSLLKREILLMQLLVPALFLILSIKKYNDHGDIVTIRIPWQAKLFIVFAIAACFADAIRTLRKTWYIESPKISNVLSLGSCISIMCFNFYGGQGAVVSGDFHHPFENIYAFQQVFELGQVPFRDFIPPSGLYSIVQGAFFKLFGNGDVAYYSLTNNIYYYTVIAAVLILLKCHLGTVWCFALALFLQFPGYNRVVFMAVVVLLLLLPQLVRRANLWLKVFLLLSVFHGLYYPVYGVACFVGFIPMFVVQVKKVLVDKDKSYRKPSFWIAWATVLIVLFASIPLLWGTFIHIKAMAGQSVLADGITIFGQELPSWFMPYSKNIFRYPLYNAMRVVPLALMVWVPVLFLCKMYSCRMGKDYFAANIEPFTAVISLIMIPLVSYTFSFVRVDMFTLFARSWSALICVFILYMVVIAKYVKDSAFSLAMLILLNVLIVPSHGIGVDATNGKLFSKINVPDGYKVIKDFGYNTVGKCFLHDGSINWLNSVKNKLSEVNGEPSFSKLGYFGAYYVFKQKGGANIEGFVMKNFAAAKETKNMLLKKRIVCGEVDPLTCYYLFNWLVASGEYVWDAERNSFMPALYDMGVEEIKAKNKKCPFFYEDYHEGNSADVFGLSFKSLRKIFAVQDFAYTKELSDKMLSIAFSEPVCGNDMDFVYLEFAEIENEYQITEFNMGGEHEKSQSELISKLFLKAKPNPAMQLSISFYDEEGERHSVRANYGNGRLLVNLGVGVKYLLEKHACLEITVTKNGEEITVPKVKDIKLLKCRHIYIE